MSRATKTLIGLGVALAFLASLTMPRGHLIGGAVTAAFGLGFAAGASALWGYALWRLGPSKPQPAEPAPGRRGLATNPPTLEHS